MMTFLYLLGAYIVGAIPTGFLVARMAGIADITQQGSGNSGATNVARCTHPAYFFLVLFLDAAKAALYLQYVALPAQSLLAVGVAVFLLIGNGISLFLGAKGGKGVATALGIVYFFHKSLLVPCSLLWVGTALLTGNIGMASVVGLLTLPLFACCLVPEDQFFILLSFFISIWGIWRHKKNICHFFMRNTCVP